MEKENAILNLTLEILKTCRDEIDLIYRAAEEKVQAATKDR